MSPGFRVLYDRIIIKRNAPETMSKGGLIIPDIGQEKPVIAKIIACGTGKIMENGSILPLSVKVDDEVIFSKHSGQAFIYGDVEYLVLTEDDILGIIE